MYVVFIIIYSLFSGYFNCYARLSDWEKLLQQLNDHLSPCTDDEMSTIGGSICHPSAFNYNLLWQTEWNRDNLLRYAFAANVQRLAQVTTVRGFTKLQHDVTEGLKQGIDEFKNFVDTWMGNSLFYFVNGFYFSSLKKHI